MTNELKNTVKFHVEIYTREGNVWTQEFIKPLVNYFSGTWKDEYGNPIALKSAPDNPNEMDKVNILNVSALFNDEVKQTLNTYGVEQGWGYDLTVADIPKGKLSVCIGVTPADDYHNDGYEVGHFDFYKDLPNGTKEWKEVEQILFARMKEIAEEDGFVFPTNPILKECA